MDKRPVKNKKNKKNVRDKQLEVSFAKKLSLRRIGIVCHNYLGEHDDFRIHVVNVDLNCRDRLHGCRGCDGCVYLEGPYECEKPTAIDEIDEFIDVDPAVHLRLVPRHTMSRLCVVNSTVYVFDGYTGNTFDESDPKFNAKWISSYVLTEKILGGVNNKEVVGESDLIKACEMKYPKYHPKAVPTPNGKKILVFSGVISPELDGCFELFDIDSNTCQLLPRIKAVFSCYETHFPTAYCFLSDTRFFLETDSGRFILHLEDPSERSWWGWEPLGFPAIPWEMRIKGDYREGFRKGFRKGFEVMEGGYVLNSDLVHYLPEMFRSQVGGVEEKWEEGPKNERSTFPLSFKPVGLRLVDKDMMLVDYNREDQVCHVCTLRAYPLDDKTQVFIDLIRIYLPTADRPALDSTLVQSLRVVIKGRVGKYAFADLGLGFSLCCL